MLSLFEYDTLILLPDKRPVTCQLSSFKYPLYNPKASLVFLLSYKNVIPDWLPAAHKELFEVIIQNGFKYSLDQVAVFNAQEIIQNPEITFFHPPTFVFYADNQIPDTIQTWLKKQGISAEKVRCIPSLAQMIDNVAFKRQAWKTIQEYLKQTS
ncbi:MAG: hypothetical protein NZ519_00170 [Bacteroidia bacterium]|nr:hypothetical protein [Bacteroidia bacterium]MDW8301977.1 hypothetical protein [Bacteroidia bacterium]